MAVNIVTDSEINPADFVGEIIQFEGTEFNTIFTSTGGFYISDGRSWQRISFDVKPLTYKGFLNQNGDTTAPYSSNFNGDASPPLIDTINGVFSYLVGSPGTYLYTKENLCADLSKINVIVTNNFDNPSRTVGWGYNDLNSIYIDTKLYTGSGFNTVDGLLYATPILIEIYK